MESRPPAKEDRVIATVLIPLPARDFDPTEVAVPWRVLTDRGHEVRFATPDGAPGEADGMMLDGNGLDPWSRVPGLGRVRFLGLLLRADSRARLAYRDMAATPAFNRPATWDSLDAGRFDALVLPGGHRARGMRAYLESTVLQRLTAAFFATDKPVGAICHGVLLAARSRDAAGRPVLDGRRTTALTWRQERTADRVARVGRWWDPGYYRTYQEEAGQPAGFMSVEHEVRRALGADGSFEDVPPLATDRLRKTAGLWRDRAEDLRPGFVVVDRNYVSARWPGDAHLFAGTLADLIERRDDPASGSPSALVAQARSVDQPGAQEQQREEGQDEVG